MPEFHLAAPWSRWSPSWVRTWAWPWPPSGLPRGPNGVAIIGATVMVVAGVMPWDKAVRAVDAHTLVLLFGMMIVAAYLRLSGFFTW